MPDQHHVVEIGIERLHSVEQQPRRTRGRGRPRRRRGRETGSLRATGARARASCRARVAVEQSTSCGWRPCSAIQAATRAAGVLAAARQRAVVVGEARVGPRGLGVAQQVNPFHVGLTLRARSSVQPGGAARTRAAAVERLRAVCESGREPCRVGLDRDPRQMQPVGVPARPDRRVAGHEPVRVLVDRVAEELEPRAAQSEDSGVGQLAGVGDRARAVTRVDVLVLASRVVQEAEQQHQLAIAAADTVRERETGCRDASPVLVAVHRGAPPPCAREHGVDDVHVNRHGASPRSPCVARRSPVTATKRRGVPDAATRSGRPRRRRPARAGRASSPRRCPCGRARPGSGRTPGTPPARASSIRSSVAR